MNIKTDKINDRVMNRKYSFIWIITLLLFTTMWISCSSNSTSSNDSSNNNNTNDDTGSTIGTEPIFANVKQIFQQSCGGSGCHISSSQNGVQLDTYDHVINSRAISYDKLAVQPGNAGGSPLVDKIESNPQAPPRMPKNGNYLSDARIQQIRQWIDNGAKNN